jgi:hypothetical protein
VPGSTRGCNWPALQCRVPVCEFGSADNAHVDKIVRSAIAKWPNVPAVYGWLALDRRGRWLLKGERIGNPAIGAFIARNYEPDAQGRWFFQNGPQRVFVDLDYTPLIVRLVDDSGFVTHTDQAVHSIGGAWIDEQGAVLIATEHGVGLVDDRDIEALSARIIDADANIPQEDALEAAIEALQQGKDSGLSIRCAGKKVPLRPIRAADVPARFGFNPHPEPPPGYAACN